MFFCLHSSTIIEAIDEVSITFASNRVSIDYQVRQCCLLSFGGHLPAVYKIKSVFGSQKIEMIRNEESKLNRKR